MSRELSITLCQVCESEFKLVFDYKLTSGEPKFCPFCSSELYDENDYGYDDNENEQE